jgi:histidinol-phosphate/aromatic aminotransferase/cobyric acid decarboxylase-like protein
MTIGSFLRRVRRAPAEQLDRVAVDPSPSTSASAFASRHGGQDVAVLVTPNNPTALSVIGRPSSNWPTAWRHCCQLVIDESFIEFSCRKPQA